MDRHRLAEERSLAYHEAIARRLEAEPDLLRAARTRVRTWVAAGDPVPLYAREWAGILDQSVAAIAAFLREDGERARELRQSTPFAGAIDARERWRIWREVGTRGIAP